MTALLLADPENDSIESIVDTERYALADPASTKRLDQLVNTTRSDLRTDGAVTLAGFLRPGSLVEMAAEIAAASEHVPIRRQSASVYSRADLEASLPAGDPRCIQQEWLAGHVTRDMMAPHTLAQRLYVSPTFKDFIARVVGAARVFEYADPLAGLVATILPPGGEYPWHYDTNEFVVTIMLQEPEGGGQFEYHQNLRTPGDENLDGLHRVLSGRSGNTARFSNVAPGDLQVFLGRYSLHRVTRVAGDLSRHVLVLSYADRPGVIGPVDRTRSVYGRVTEAHLVAAEARTNGTDGLIL